MIEETIVRVFNMIKHTWKVGDQQVQPNQDDVQRVLDEVAKELSKAAVGDRLSIAGLVIEKRPVGHDVYCYVGSYM